MRSVIYCLTVAASLFASSVSAQQHRTEFGFVAPAPITVPKPAPPPYSGQPYQAYTFTKDRLIQPHTDAPYKSKVSTVESPLTPGKLQPNYKLAKPQLGQLDQSAQRKGASNTYIYRTYTDPDGPFGVVCAGPGCRTAP
jgi:hypothetical protein